MNFIWTLVLIIIVITFLSFIFTQEYFTHWRRLDDIYFWRRHPHFGGWHRINTKRRRRRRRRLRKWRKHPRRRTIWRYFYPDYYRYNYIPENPGCDGKACGGYCNPFNSKCCGGTNPSTCGLSYCENNQLCN